MLTIFISDSGTGRGQLRLEYVVWSSISDLHQFLHFQLHELWRCRSKRHEARCCRTRTLFLQVIICHCCSYLLCFKFLCFVWREYRKKNTTVEENPPERVYYREHRLYYFSKGKKYCSHATEFKVASAWLISYRFECIEKDTSGPGLNLNDVITTVNPIYVVRFI